MRYKYVIITILMVFITILGLGIFSLNKNTVNMDFIEGNAIFTYNGTSISHILAEQELSLIGGIFNGKQMYKDNPSCGFTDDVAIIFNNSQTFCLACDTCPVIYWKEKNRFFKITESEKVQLYNILEGKT